MASSRSERKMHICVSYLERQESWVPAMAMTTDWCCGEWRKKLCKIKRLKVVPEERQWIHSAKGTNHVAMGRVSRMEMKPLSLWKISAVQGESTSSFAFRRIMFVLKWSENQMTRGAHRKLSIRKWFFDWNRKPFQLKKERERMNLNTLISNVARGDEKMFSCIITMA